MTQYSRRALPIGKILLLLAALVAAFAVGASISNHAGSPPPTSSSGAAAGGEAPTIATLVAKTKASPQDLGAWQALGQAYFEEGRFDDAVHAYERASEVDGGKADVWSALGEARVMASKRDPMPQAAVDAFQRAIKLDPADPRARYFLAVHKDLSGDHQGAIADWLALLSDTPADAPWRDDLVRTIEQVGKIRKIDVSGRLAAAGAKSPPAAGPAPATEAALLPPAARAIPGPSAQDLAAAAQIPPSQQQQMAEGMVARLEARLKTQPKNVDGWIMLMRSRVTLGEPAKASQALKDAIAANPGQADHLRQQAEILGVH